MSIFYSHFFVCKYCSPIKRNQCLFFLSLVCVCCTHVGRGMCMHVPVEGRGWWHVSSLVTVHLTFWDSLPLNIEFTDLVILTARKSQDFPCLSLSGIGITTNPAFLRGYQDRKSVRWNLSFLCHKANSVKMSKVCRASWRGPEWPYLRQHECAG